MGFGRRRSRACAVIGAALLPGALAAQTTCEQSCSGHGRCGAYAQCSCASGFEGADCSLRICPFAAAWVSLPSEIAGDDDGHAAAECANKGLCDRLTGLCECAAGFEGAACERRSCSLDCSGRGACVSLGYLARRADAGAGTVYDYAAWDAEMMRGCDCASEYAGHDCSLFTCPVGDDPMTTGQMNEVQMVTCRATSGTASLAFKGAHTEPIAWNAPAADMRAALLSLPTFQTVAGDEAWVDERGLLPVALNKQLVGALSVAVAGGVDAWCGNPAVTSTLTFLQDFGDQPLVVPDARLLGYSLFPGRVGTLSIVQQRAGTKERETCSNRGLCNDLSGRCDCDQQLWTSSDGYGAAGSRGDCGVAVDESDIMDCPGETACSGHGACDDSSYRCACQTGWRGADCSLMTCPQGRSWFSRPTAADTAHAALAECSDLGVCDSTVGACTCADGFAGSACEYAACPTNDAGADCGAQGECKTMAQLAIAARETAPFRVGSLNAITLSALSLSLSFHANARRASQSSKATRSHLRQAGFTYGEDPNDAYTWDREMVRGCHCDESYAGYDCSLRVCEKGDDPLTPAVESLECSGRGLCDRSMGTCQCFSQYGASDGNGAKGTIDDCGYVLPLALARETTER